MFVFLGAQCTADLTAMNTTYLWEEKTRKYFSSQKVIIIYLHVCMYEYLFIQLLTEHRQIAVT